MRDLVFVANSAGIANIDPGATGPRLGDGLAMIIKLHGQADDIIAPIFQQDGCHRAIDAAGHGDNDALPPGWFGQEKSGSRLCKLSCKSVIKFVLDFNLVHGREYKGEWRGWETIPRCPPADMAAHRENSS